MTSSPSEPSPRLLTVHEHDAAIARYRELYRPLEATPPAEGTPEELIRAELLWLLDTDASSWCPVCGENHPPITACKPADVEAVHDHPCGDFECNRCYRPRKAPVLTGILGDVSLAVQAVRGGGDYEMGPGGWEAPQIVPPPQLDEPVHALRSAPAQDHPCELVRLHVPRVVITEHHHRKPTYLQQRLWGEVRVGPELWVCSNCHEAIHAWLYWLLGERKEPRGVGRAAKAEAQKTYDWYVTQKAIVDAGPTSG